MKFYNLLSSGYTFSKEEYSAKLSYILFNSMLLFNLLLLIFATALRLYESNYYQALFDCLYVLASITVFAIARISRSYFVVSFYALLFMSYLLITFSFYKGNNPIGGMGWYFILLMTVVFIRGYKEGVIFFLISTATIVTVSILGHHTPVKVFIGIMPFVVAYFFIRFYEKRNMSFQKIVEAQKNLYAYQAKYDKLTNIPNREFFFDQLEEILTEVSNNREKIAILFIDLDSFKEVNDTCGHQAGDEVLAETSRRLKVELGERDVLARFGGDEFVIIIKDIESVERVLSRFAVMMQEPIATHVKQLTVSFSVGSAIFPDHGRTETELMGHADRAMYQAKKKNKHRYREAC